MAAEVTIDIGKTGQPASDWIALDADASYRLDSSATFGGSYSEVATVKLTTGTDRYERWDPAGTVGSTWYRFRIEDDGDVALSDYTHPFQVAPSRPIATLASVKAHLGGSGSSSDDDLLQTVIDGVNGAIVHRLGYWPGPSSETTLVLHGKDAVRGGRRLWVRGGVRSLSELRIAGATGDVATAAGAGDYVLGGPDAHLLRPGEPHGYVELLDVVTGPWSSFPHGHANVEMDGAFGWAQPPDDLVYWASWLSVTLWKARSSATGLVGSTDFGNVDLSRLPDGARRAIDSYRFVG